MKRAVGVRASLRVDAYDVRTGLCKGGNERVGRRDHQMHIQHGRHMRADRLHQWRPKGEVRYEMPVHHIDMHPVAALCFDRADFHAETGEVGAEYRRGDLDAAVKAHRGLSVRGALTLSFDGSRLHAQVVALTAPR